MRLTVALGLGTLGAAIAAGSAPTRVSAQGPVFRSGVDLVQLDVVVLDERRRPVANLVADDFTVLEDGQARPIRVFVPVQLRPRLEASGAPWTREASADVVENRRSEDGRLVVIMMDRSIVAGAQTVVARQIAEAVVDALGPDDQAAVVRSSGFAGEGISQNFTADRARLRKALESPFVGLTPTPAPGGGAPPDLTATGDCICGLCALEAIERVAAALGNAVRRQKTIVFVGSDIVVTGRSGRPTFDRGVMDCTELVRHARERALRALDRANVTVHSVDTSGLETLADSAGSVRRTAPATRRDANTERQANLKYFPDHTGGRAVLNTNEPGRHVDDIFAESSTYYLIGFERGSPSSSGRPRDIRVRVGRDSVTVRARSAYYEPVSASATESAKGRPASANQALVELLPKSDLPLSLSLGPTFLTNGKVAVGLLLGIETASPLGVPPGAAPPAPEIAAGEKVGYDVVIGVFDRRARSVATARESVSSPTDVATLGFEWQSMLPLPPGSYEVRVAVSREGTDRSGSVFGYVDVPPVATEALQMSAVRLSVRSGPSTSGAPSPTLRRAFTADDRVFAGLQIRRPAADRRSVSLRTRIIDDRDVTLAVSEVTVPPERFSAAGVSELILDIGVSALPPGRYLFTIDEPARVDGERRAVPFVRR